MTIFRPIGEPEIHFEFDMNLMLHHLQRIKDFLAGMGVIPQSSCFEFVWFLQMTVSQKKRWDEWLITLQ